MAYLERLLYNVNYTHSEWKTRILKQLCLFFKNVVCYKELHKSVWGVSVCINIGEQNVQVSWIINLKPEATTAALGWFEGYIMYSMFSCLMCKSSKIYWSPFHTNTMLLAAGQKLYFQSHKLVMLWQVFGFKKQ